MTPPRSPDAVQAEVARLLGENASRWPMIFERLRAAAWVGGLGGFVIWGMWPIRWERLDGWETFLVTASGLGVTGSLLWLLHPLARSVDVHVASVVKSSSEQRVRSTAFGEVRHRRTLAQLDLGGNRLFTCRTPWGTVIPAADGRAGVAWTSGRTLLRFAIVQGLALPGGRPDEREKAHAGDDEPRPHDGERPA